jgi:hypothetical protein
MILSKGWGEFTILLHVVVVKIVVGHMTNSTRGAVVWVHSCTLPFMSQDEYDQLPDPFAGVDWNVVPGLSILSPTSQSRDRSSAGLKHSTPTLANEEDFQYFCEDVDAALLAEIDKVERKLLQPRGMGLGAPLTPITIEGGKQEASRYSDTGGELTSRYFLGEYML